MQRPHIKISIFKFYRFDGTAVALEPDDESDSFPDDVSPLEPEFSPDEELLDELEPDDWLFELFSLDELPLDELLPDGAPLPLLVETSGRLVASGMSVSPDPIGRGVELLSLGAVEDEGACDDEDFGTGVAVLEYDDPLCLEHVSSGCEPLSK